MRLLLEKKHSSLQLKCLHTLFCILIKLSFVMLQVDCSNAMAGSSRRRKRAADVSEMELTAGVRVVSAQEQGRKSYTIVYS